LYNEGECGKEWERIRSLEKLPEGLSGDYREVGKLSLTRQLVV